LPRRNGNGRYYLEASLALLDAPSEWFFDKDTHVLYLYPPDGRSPADSGIEIRAKASTYTIEIGAPTAYLDLANITFVATAITATSYDPEAPHGGDASVSNIRFESLNFSYPSSSRRMLQDLAPIDCMAVWANVSGGAKAQTYSNHRCACENQSGESKRGLVAVFAFQLGNKIELNDATVCVFRAVLSTSHGAMPTAWLCNSRALAVRKAAIFWAFLLFVLRLSCQSWSLSIWKARANERRFVLCLQAALITACGNGTHGPLWAQWRLEIGSMAVRVNNQIAQKSILSTRNASFTQTS
jgi:hypothetical protein